MLIRLAWAWTALIASWASLVASKSPAVYFEVMSAYGIYNIAWQYKGAEQRYIYPHLDPVKDAKLFEESYRKKGHQGSLPNGKMTWQEFAAAWFLDDKLDPRQIPPLNLDKPEETAKALFAVKGDAINAPINLAAGHLPKDLGGEGKQKYYYEVLEGWRDMVVEARGHLPLEPMKDDLKLIALASAQVEAIRRIEHSQTDALGKAMKRVFPGIRIVGTQVALPDFGRRYKTVDVAATLSDPDNKRNWPDILDKAFRAGRDQLPSDPVDWRERFELLTQEYGRETWLDTATEAMMTPEQKKLMQTMSAVSHRKVLEAARALKETALNPPACQG
ncbi:hypothetical protein B0T20DRAFT_141503 [Sordaria brevicollis]|uniref:Uncharacterized protein n=1 Tax=Sordaria brevicollis TaxID=83679 RepID=A0AAE0NRC0_SORBR|nr:hypothetical protein B0T20DRAFT_141503 [Sordaria brevicollis]